MPPYRHLRTWIAATVVALGLVSPGAAAAQNTLDGPGADRAAAASVDAHLAARPIVRTVWTDGAVRLDGVLGEAAWAAVVPATGFVQTEPLDGAPATDRTEVRILHDDDALYIGVRLEDAAGDVRSRLGRRDAFLADSDWLLVALDSYHGHEAGYQFAVNPSGVKRDAITQGESIYRDDASWDAVWDVATSVDAGGWTVEMRIPFSQLRFAAADVQTWGIQVTRRQVAKEETTVLAHSPKSVRGGPSRWGHVVGLEGIRPGRRAEVLPYVTTRAEFQRTAAGDPFRSGRDWSAVTGVDVKLRLTSSMTLDVTANPDFGQVEVDPAVVNLSAFETSFDEKRPFFVEGSDIFRFGDTRMFYSRRIGRAPQGDVPGDAQFSDRPDAATILGAAKVTGRTSDGWRLGALAAVTAEERARFLTSDAVEDEVRVEPRTGFVVVRAEKAFREGGSRVGAILTGLERERGDAALDARLRGSAYTGGLDFSHEFLDRTWQLDGSVAASRVSGSAAALVRTQRASSRYFQRPDADHLRLDSARTALGGFAGRIGLRRIAGEHWRGEASVSATSPGFEINDLGFQTRVDRIGADLDVTYVQNRPSPLFRDYRVSLRNGREWNWGGDVVDGRTHLGFFGELSNYWRGGLSLSRDWATFDDRLTRGGPLARSPAGWDADFNLNTDSRRTVSGRLRAGYGRTDGGGSARSASVDLTFRPADNWTVSVGPSYRNGRTPAQYLTSAADAAADATFGRAWVFAPLEQTTVSMDTRLNVNFSPTLSLDLFAQPFIASGVHGDPVRLRAPRSYAFDPYEGAAAGRDFVTRSLRGNAVLRWEWQPGSTLFLVWQQRRSGSVSCPAGTACEAPRFDLGRDARALFDAVPENLFQIKLTYWLNL